MGFTFRPNISSASTGKKLLISSKYSNKPIKGNPNPYNFIIIDSVEIGKYLVVKIKYPDCTNYEGKKILVFDNLNFNKLLKLKAIDPHFFDDNCSPIARFKPTEEGWKMAIRLCKEMSL